MNTFLKYLKRFLPLILIVAGMAAVFFTGAYHYFSFDSLKSYHQIIKTYVSQHPVSVPIIFILVYIAITAMSIPGAVFLTLLGGYLFPQPQSSIYVIFAATCGATLIFLAARTALGDFLRKKAGPFLKKMEKGFQENAVSYMLFLRFVPVFPFWLVNIAPAILGVSLITFVWTTLVGITPGTIVFTLAGGGLEKIFESQQEFSINTIFNLQVKIALGLLAVISLVPIIWKRFRKRHDRNKSS
ncbi:MAG TPA: TVP38/TMEM64 family protein [Rhabdochlamydiaceae bacterium]|nr:TVP38/TMEM64 family protein [Rhabdochlamydiaceae bacterium]